MVFVGYSPTFYTDPYKNYMDPQHCFREGRLRTRLFSFYVRKLIILEDNCGLSFRQLGL